MLDHGGLDEQEAARARGDRRQAEASRCAGGPGADDRRRGALDRGDADQLRDELLEGEIFYSLREAEVLIEAWRRHYNTQRPHSALGYRPPAPEVAQGPAAHPRPASPATSAVAIGTMH